MDNLKFEDSTLDAQTVTQAVSLPVAPISEGAIAVHGSPVTSITPLRSSIPLNADIFDPLADSSIDNELDKIGIKHMPESNMAPTGPAASVSAVSSLPTTNNAGSAIELGSVGSSTSASLAVASTSHTLPQLDNALEPLVDATRPVKKSKLPNAAVVGSGFTGKNFAMKHWLGTNPGGSKVDFEAFFKSLEAEQKKVYDDQAKTAKKLAKAETRRVSKDSKP